MKIQSGFQGPLQELEFHTKFTSESESNIKGNNFPQVVRDPDCSHGCLNLRSGVHATSVHMK